MAVNGARKEEEEEFKHELDGQDEEWMDDEEAPPSTLLVSRLVPAQT